MAEALERQKANIVKKQVVWGREFQGQAFLSKPKVLLFKDFVVGKVYTKKVTLTNVSYTFSTFKVREQLTLPLCRALSVRMSLAPPSPFRFHLVLTPAFVLSRQPGAVGGGRVQGLLRHLIHISWRHVCGHVMHAHRQVRPTAQRGHRHHHPVPG